MLIIENADVCSPAPRGRVSITIAGPLIEKIGEVDARALAQQLEVETLDATGCIATPGLIDPHVHLIGGSGESGFATQTPPVFASELFASGITTVAGLLGTDTTTRTMPALLAAVKALREEGLSAFAWTGGYDARPLTASVRDDIVLIDEIIGAGEYALSDRRAIEPTPHALATLATDCYVAGTLTRKAGLLLLHIGDGKRRLAPLRDALDSFDVEPSWFYPTHVERNEPLMAEAIELSRRGMPIDVDVYERDLVRWVRFHREHDGDPALLTASSDAAIKSPRNLLDQLRACVHEKALDLEHAFALATSNTARILKLHDRGELEAGRRADVLLLDRESLELRHVICGGRVVVRDGSVVQRERFLRESDREIHLIGAKVHGREEKEKG
jgi:beta-aspartyl-dipeptidase (metallo-type)